jgi:hypothetical protein
MGDRIYGVVAADGDPGHPWHTGRDQEQFVLYKASYKSSEKLLLPQNLDATYSEWPPGIDPIYPDTDAFKLSVETPEGATYDAMPFWDALRRIGAVRNALLGVNAVVVGLLLAALYDPVWTSAILSATDFGLALAAFTLLVFWKTPPWLVVILTALGGWALQAGAMS